MANEPAQRGNPGRGNRGGCGGIRQYDGNRGTGTSRPNSHNKPSGRGLGPCGNGQRNGTTYRP